MIKGTFCMNTMQSIMLSSLVFIHLSIHGSGAAGNKPLDQNTKPVSNAFEKVDNREIIRSIVAVYNTVKNYENAPPVDRICKVFSKSHNTDVDETIVQSSDDSDKLLSLQAKLNLLQQYNKNISITKTLADANWWRGWFCRKKIEAPIVPQEHFVQNNVTNLNKKYYITVTNQAIHDEKERMRQENPDVATLCNGKKSSSDLENHIYQENLKHYQYKSLNQTKRNYECLVAATIVVGGVLLTGAAIYASKKYGNQQ